MIGDPNEGVKLQARIAIDSLKNPQAELALPVLRRLLADKKESANRATAIRTIGSIRDPAAQIAVTELTGRLDDEDKSLRMLAVTAIGALGGPEARTDALPRILKQLGAVESDDLVTVIRAVRKIGGMQEIIKLLDDKQPLIRRAATDVIQEDPGPDRESVVPALIKLLSDADLAVRDRAVGALAAAATTESQAALSALNKLFDDPNVGSDRAVAEAIGRIGGTKALVGLLDDARPAARKSAASALGWNQEAARKAILSLVKRLDDQDEAVRSSVTRDIVEIAGPDDQSLIPDLIKYIGKPEQKDRIAAIKAIEKIKGAGGRKTLPLLTKLLDDGSFVDRAATCDAIAAIAGPDDSQYLPAIEKLFGKTKPGIGSNTEKGRRVRERICHSW